MTNTIAPPTLEELNKRIAAVEELRVAWQGLPSKAPFDIELYCLYAVRDGVATGEASFSEAERHAIKHAQYVFDHATPDNPDCCFDYEFVRNLLVCIEHARSNCQFIDALPPNRKPLLELLCNSYNDGFNEGMREDTSHAGGKTWSIKKQKYSVCLDKVLNSPPPRVEVDHVLSPWQPIETAPKDGTKILITVGDNLVGVGYWDNDTSGLWALWLSSIERMRPTHWMPLPAPPTHNSPPDAKASHNHGEDVQ